MATATRSAGEAAAGGLTGAPAPEGARLAGDARERGGPASDVTAASALEGETVLDLQGESVGEIEDIMLDVKSGRIAYAVLAVGGFLGIGEKYFAVPWRALTLDADRKCFVLDVDKDTLENAPAFDRDHWPAMSEESWASRIDAYWK
jgi:sporulation protein YlmC with PRC-barrel domain